MKRRDVLTIFLLTINILIVVFILYQTFLKVNQKYFKDTELVKETTHLVNNIVDNSIEIESIKHDFELTKISDYEFIIQGALREPFLIYLYLDEDRWHCYGAPSYRVPKYCRESENNLILINQ